MPPEIALGERRDRAALRPLPIALLLDRVNAIGRDAGTRAPLWVASASEKAAAEPMVIGTRAPLILTLTP
jgi:hypothetical protein